MAASVDEALRACGLGIRSLLVDDLGVLETLGRMRGEGRLPADLVLKTSVLLPLTNGPTGALYERLGAHSPNVSTDLTVAQIGEVRAATTVPIDIYVEVPDDQGGSVRPSTTSRTSSGWLRRSTSSSGSATHRSSTRSANTSPAPLRALGRERVRRTELVLRLLAELSPETT